MKIEVVRNLFQEKGDFRLLFLENQEERLVFETDDIKIVKKEMASLRKSFWDSGLEVWSNSQRVVVTKVYESFTYFKQTWRQEQIIISNLLNYLPLKYKNNLYFLIVLEFDWKNDINNELLMEKNRAEKNTKYCRKYIIQDAVDLERIPFFNNVEKPIVDSFAYEQKFIDRLESESQGLSPDIVQIIHDYFKPKVRSVLHDKESLKAIIEDGLEEGKRDADSKIDH